MGSDPVVGLFFGGVVATGFFGGRFGRAADLGVCSVESTRFFFVLGLLAFEDFGFFRAGVSGAGDGTGPGWAADGFWRATVARLGALGVAVVEVGRAVATGGSGMRVRPGGVVRVASCGGAAESGTMAAG